MLYKPGDIVEFITDIDGIPKGTLTKVLSYFSDVGFHSELLFSDPRGRGHSEGGGKRGQCWNIYESQVKFYTRLTKEERIINKCKKLWNQSTYVQNNPEQMY